MMDVFPRIAGNPLQFPQIFDAMWRKADLTLWEAGKHLDGLGESGRVAREFGLINPHDRNRPTFTQYFFKSLEPSNNRIEASSTPAPVPPPYVDSIPTAAPSESAAKSGHAYVAETSENRPKSKKKTKGVVASKISTNQEPDRIDEIEEEPSLATFPFSLPTHFKLGKRLLKVWISSRHKHSISDPGQMLRFSTVSSQMIMTIPQTMRPGKVSFAGGISNA
jgi:hypothetical protein